MDFQGQTGKKIEHYIYNYADFIGKGNFSKCYKATDTRTQQQVAIKIVELNSLKSKKLEQLLFSEIGVLRQLDHPNVLRCHEVFSSNRNCYIITQFCNEGDLESHFKKKRQYDEREIRNIAADVFKGLVYLGSKGIIHRDLKIANVFMNNGVAKIADFGFAVHSIGLFNDLNIGSPLYMSPEGIHHNMYGPKTDVWAFGIMLYQLYHGSTPHSLCLTEAELKASVLRPLQCNQLKQSIPSDAKELILACLQIKEDQRPFIHELNSFAYIQQALRNRQSTSNLSFNFQSPAKQLLKRNIEPESAAGRHKQKYRTAFQSQQKQRNVNRPFTPQKNIYQTPLVNASLQLTSNNPSVDTQNYNQTWSGIQSPIMRKNNHLNLKVPNPSNNFQVLTTPFQVNKQYLNKGQPFINKRQKSPFSFNTHPLLINGQVTFKESVGLLHFCRLIFKYLQVYQQNNKLSRPNEKKHFAILGHFLLTALEEVYEQAKNKKIKYEGDNAELRERKLNEVIEEYRKKYSKELDKNIIHSFLSEEEKTSMNLSLVYQTVTAESNLLLSQYCSNQEAIAAELLLTILSSSSLLEDCYQKKNYTSFQKSKEIEQILNKSKENFSFESYQAHRNKITFRQPNF